MCRAEQLCWGIR